MAKNLRAESDKTSQDFGKSCVVCEFGHFVDSPPLSGECRKSPPRSFLERDGRQGRFFPQVKHDDWCGQYKFCGDNAKVERFLLALEPFQNRENRLELAEQYESLGNFEKALEIFESEFESESQNQDLAFKIAKLYFELSKKRDDRSFQDTAHHWQLKASELGHPEAPFFVGLTLAQRGTSDEANKYLDLSCERGFSRAIRKRDNGGFNVN